MANRYPDKWIEFVRARGHLSRAALEAEAKAFGHKGLTAERVARIRVKVGQHGRDPRRHMPHVLFVLARPDMSPGDLVTACKAAGYPLTKKQIRQI